MQKIIPGIAPLFFLIFVASIVVMGLGAALLPVIFAALLSYLLFPVVKKLEAKGVRPGFSAIAVLIFTILMMALFFFALVPILLNEVRGLVADAPSIIDSLLVQLNHVFGYFGYQIPVTRTELLSFISDSSGIDLDVFKSMSRIFGKAFSSVLAAVFFVFNSLLIPVFYFFFTIEHNRIVQAIGAMIPPRYLPAFREFGQRSNQIVAGYFRGQLLVALIVGSIYGIGYTVIGLRFGFLIGLLTGFLHAVPYIGPATGVVLASAIGLSNFEHIQSVLGVWIVFLIGQTLESFVITPKVVGNRVGLTALETIMILMVAGNMGGIPAMLVAIPVGGMMKVLVKSSMKLYLKSDLYTGR
jgi:predicted PurR-regulated permease PerM